MAANPTSGFLAIADLTGYSAYLARGEIEHAPVIAGDLIETVVGRLEPPFRLAKLEGDAALLYVEDGRADGPLLFDAIEASYLAFRRRLRSIQGATSCECAACSLAPRLDLKLFLHHGQFVLSRIAGHDELAGPSVIVVHRLLKGRTAQEAHRAGGQAPGFAILTADALSALGMRPGELGLQERHESIEHFGDVAMWVMDLETRWGAENEQRRIEIAPEQALIDLEVAIAAERARVWAALTSPAERAAWEGAIVMVDGSGGLLGVGTTARCVTGRLATIEEIVDWQPFEHVAYRVAMPDLGPVDVSYDLDAVGERTLVRLRWGQPGVDGVDAGALQPSREERRSALGRLARFVESGAGNGGQEVVA